MTNSHHSHLLLFSFFFLSLCLFFFVQAPVGNLCAVIGNHLFHSDLSMLYNKVFLMMCKAHGIRFNKKVTIQNWSARFSIIISTVPVIWLIQRETAQILHIRVCFQVLMSTTAYGGRATYRKGVNLKSLDLKQGWNALIVSTLCYTMMKLYFSLFFVACVSDKARHSFRFFWQQ